MGLDRQSTSFMVLFLSFSNVISNILTITSGLLVARWVLPDTLGTFNIFTIVSGYIILVQLGIPSALARELPFYIGRGNSQEAYKYASVGQQWQKTLGILALVFGAIAAIIFYLYGQYEYAAGSLTVGVTTWQILYVTKYLKILYRTNQDFNRLATIKIISAFVVFGSIVFVWMYGFYGLCLRAVISAGIDFFLSYRWRPIKVKATWDFVYFKSLMRTGLPMFSVASIYGLWPLVQRTLILSLGGPKALGLFTLAYMAEHAMVTVSSSLNSVVYPRMANLWGEGATVGELIRVVSKPIVMSMALLLIALPFGWWLLPLFVRSLIPNYSEGIQAAQLMLLVGFVEPLSAYSNIYNVMRNQRDRLIVYLTGVISWFVTVYVLYLVYGFSLISFPVGMIVAFLVMSVINFVHIRRDWEQKAEEG